MVSFSSAAVFAALLAGTCHASDSLRHGRRLSFERIAGYTPASLVTDHNALDLDQAELEQQLARGTDESFAIAKSIYTDGAFSKSFATVTLTTALMQPLNKGDEVIGATETGDEVNGKLLKDYPLGSPTIDVQYETNSIQSSYVGCQVGANPIPMAEGCFVANGTLTVEGVGSMGYLYDPLEKNGNARTLQGFSLQAEDKMSSYSTYKKFKEYYGEFDYANKWVLAAFDGSRTNFENGDADFTLYGKSGLTEVIKKGTVYMNVWMYVIHEMEDAINDCQAECFGKKGCNDDPVHAWDEAVAFYTGSLEGSDGSGSGKFLHALADKRCANFATCGDLASETSGTSHVNMEIFRQFADGKRKLLTGKCPELRVNKERIEQLMAVPLIQGTIRYANTISTQIDPGEIPKAEGAVFAASVLPLVHFCDSSAADTIYNSMKAGKNNEVNFVDVKKAFESVYDCLGLRCEDVGGLWDTVNGGYLSDAAPCGTGSGSRDNVGLAVGLSVGGVFLVALVVFISSKIGKSGVSEEPDLAKGEPEPANDLELKGEGAVVS